MKKEYYCSHCGKKNIVDNTVDFVKQYNSQKHDDISRLEADQQPDTHKYIGHL